MSVRETSASSALTFVNSSSIRLFIDWAMWIQALEDDKRYFPPYQAAPILRADTARKHPAVKAALESLGGTISSRLIRRANFRSPSSLAQ